MIEPSHWIRESHCTTEITRPADLDVRPDAAFEVARAPDGLPLVMHVQRAADVRRPVLRSSVRWPSSSASPGRAASAAGSPWCSARSTR